MRKCGIPEFRTGMLPVSSHMVSEYFELKRDDISSAIDNDTQDRQTERQIEG